MKKISSYLIIILSIALGIFFIYKGINKNLLYDYSIPKIIEEGSSKPIEYQNLMKVLYDSKFMIIIGVLEVLAGLLLIIPKTRLLGSIILMPVILNIFLLHLIIDNRPHELVETGIPLLVNVIIFMYYYPKWKDLLWVK